MLLSKGAVCDSKKLKFIKEQEASGLSNGLGIKTTFVLRVLNKLMQDIK